MAEAREGLASAAERAPGERRTDGPGGPPVRLDANEHPLPPLPSVLAAMGAALNDVNRYPEPTGAPLRRAIARHHDIDPDLIAVGPGAGALCERALVATCEPGDRVVFADPSFVGYRNHVATARAEAVRVPLDACGGHDLDAMAAAVDSRTRALIVCNPNNPTGTPVGHDEVRRLLDRVPDDLLVVLDEAYIDFAEPGRCARGRDLIDEHENVLVVRTFSKAHGLAGLRVGYAMARPAALAAVTRSRGPFQVNAVGQAAAIASLAALDELSERVEAVRSERARLTERLRALGHAPLPSEANFVWVPMDGAAATEVARRLERAGVLVRPMSGGLRVTVGTRAENDRLIDALGREGQALTRTDLG